MTGYPSTKRKSYQVFTIVPHVTPFRFFFPFPPDNTEDCHAIVRIRVEEAFGTAVIEFLSLFFRHENTPAHAGVFSRREDNGTMSGTNLALPVWIEENPEKRRR